MFAPMSGLMEDPATGSANGALAALLAAIAPEPDAVFAFDIRHGHSDLAAIKIRGFKVFAWKFF